jgi:hypothetical protein
VSGVTNVLLGPDLVAERQAGGPFFNFDQTNQASPPISRRAIPSRSPAALGRRGSNSPTNRRISTRRRT